MSGRGRHTGMACGPPSSRMSGSRWAVPDWLMRIIVDVGDPPSRTGRLGDVLARRRRFVGRAAELELMKVALEATEPTFSVLYLHGPGGVGKTFLLDAIERIAEDRAVPVRRVDGRVVAESRSSLTEALAGLLDTAPNAADSAPVVGPVVVLVDAFERLAPMEDWIRVDLLPRLPASSVTVPAPGGRRTSAATRSAR